MARVSVSSFWVIVLAAWALLSILGLILAFLDYGDAFTLPFLLWLFYCTFRQPHVPSYYSRRFGACRYWWED